MTGRVLLAWTLVSLCVVAIWTFSGEGFSATTTSRLLGPFLRWIHPEISREQLRTAHWLVRKGAHLIEYALLGLLALRALRLTLPTHTLRIVGLTLGLVAVVASADEWRQARPRARTGSLGDVAIDFFGGALGAGLLLAIGRRPPLRDAPAPGEAA